MCEACPPSNGYDYSSAYRNSESVTVAVNAYCPKCSGRLEVKTQIHFGGEFWEPFLGCTKCHWGVVISVHIGPVNGVHVSDDAGHLDEHGKCTKPECHCT